MCANVRTRRFISASSAARTRRRAGRARGHEREEHQDERGRADPVDVGRRGTRREPVVEDLLDQDRRDERGDRHPERHDHREPQARAELRALAHAAAQHRPGALQLLGDGEVVVVARAPRARRSRSSLPPLVGPDDGGVARQRGEQLLVAARCPRPCRPRGRSRGRRGGSWRGGRRPRSAWSCSSRRSAPRISASIEGSTARGGVVEDQRRAGAARSPARARRAAARRPTACGRARPRPCRSPRAARG